MPPHKFDGRWSHFKLSDSFPPGVPEPADPFDLKIPNATTGNLGADSTVEGKPVSGKASVDEKRLDLLRVEPGNERTYVGHFIKRFVVNETETLVIVGRYKDNAVPIEAKGSKKDKKVEKAEEAQAQDEGTWIITKP